MKENANNLRAIASQLRKLAEQAKFTKKASQRKELDPKKVKAFLRFYGAL